MRFGIIGLGNQGSYYARELFEGGKVQGGVLTALCDCDPDKLEGGRSRLSGEYALFTDHRELLRSGLCDAVLIETPHYFHPRIAMDCFRAGVGVICDKPAGVYADQVREMNAEAKRCKALFTVMFNQRTNCVYRRMREIIAEGGIGQLQRVTWIITDWYRTAHYYKAGAWRATWEGEGGGVLINQCPHQLDLVQWVVGEMPAAVRGFCRYGKWHDIEVEDEVTAYFEYANGATGVFVTTTGETPGTNRFEVSGTRGKLLCENDALTYWRNEGDSLQYSREAKDGYSRPPCITERVETDGKNFGHAGIINNFIAAAEGREELFVDGCEGLKGVELMNAIEFSGWKGGERVVLPVSGEVYRRELEKHFASTKKEGSHHFDS